MTCPKCGAPCDRDEVDIGVGVQCGPYQCSECTWVEWGGLGPELGPMTFLDELKPVTRDQWEYLTKKGSWEPMPVNLTNYEDVFTYHPPKPGQPEQYQIIRDAAKALTLAILQTTPQCADQQAAIRHVREAVMTANAAIALDGSI